MKGKMIAPLMCWLVTATAAFSAASEPVIPPLNATPGPEYADEVRMFQGIPAIERAPNGRLWAAWYGGGITEDKNNYIILDTSGDDGRTWQRALILDPDRDGPVRAFDPCLWHDPAGKLWLFWAQRPDSRPADCMAITTTESGNAKATWSAPRRFFEGIMMNKPTVAADGRWLAPAAVWFSNDSAHVMATVDQGKTYTQIGAANIPDRKDRNCDEHMLVQKRDQSLWLLVRTRYGIGESVSKDGGKTWPEVVPSPIPHPTTRFFIRRLSSGNLLLVRHDPPNNARTRSHLKAFLSEDDGQTWKGGLLLDERRNVSYPDGVQASNGLLYVIYDWERQRDKEILMATFREADVLQGTMVSPDGRLRARINQATGTNAPATVQGKRAANEDGKPLLKGPAPEIEYGEGEADVMNPGAKLFLDRNYTAQEVPAALRGNKFVRFNIGGGRILCRQPGVVYLITPSAGRQRDSLAEALLKSGFEKVKLPEFLMFDGEQNVCTVFQKRLVKEEALNVEKWGILVLPGQEAKLSRISSVELAADTETLKLWDPQVPFPPYDEMPDLPVVTHVQVERAVQGGYHYLHEPALAWHKNVLHAGWANHRLFEINVKDELLRGTTSTDGGLTWAPAKIWAEKPLLGGESFNHPVLYSHQGKLWGFFTRWEKEQPRTELFTLDEAAGTWQPLNQHIPGFIPFTPPRKLRDGNWIIGGELLWYEAAVAISYGDDFTRWDVVQIPRPESIKLMFPETTFLEQGNALVAICRPKDAKTAPASVSTDCGRTWTPLRQSNFPLAASKPLSGRLSTGQQYLITGNLEQGRNLMSIAVTAPGDQTLCRIWKIRHQQSPKRRLLGSQDGKKTHVGNSTEWSYPAAVEHDGKLYIIYTQGKEDCALSIIPVTALAVK
ncbi:MAG: sialidase family protein [Verrucomicrobiota bacterium]